MVLVPFATRHATRGMVSTIDPLASGAGIAMLRAGGSAADAAIAANAVLAVTSQHLCGMGGDLFALVHERPGPPDALNASGRAGSGADPERLRAEGFAKMPRNDDIRAVPVPGCVDGWLALHAKFGRLALRDVLAPARQAASEGFPASPSLAAAAPRVSGIAEGSDYAAASPIQPGTVVRRAGLADALAAIGDKGRAGWYEGRFGEELIELGAGEYNEDDLRRPQADWVAPLGLDIWRHRHWTIPPNSQGYLTLASAWIASGLDLPDDPTDPAWAHLTVEAARHASYDRNDVLHEAADGAALLDGIKLASRRDAISRDRVAALADTYSAGGTTALCAADDKGMGVVLIQSNAAGFGSGLAVPGSRVFLQNRGLGFSLEPGHPAEYGPGRRPPHTLSPMLSTTQSGALTLLAATMGGDSQPQILLQLLCRLHAGADVGEAMASGRWTLKSAGTGIGFDTWTDRGEVVVDIEGHAPEGWAAGLERRGHRVARRERWRATFGHAHLIEVQDGVYAGAADPRHTISAVAVL